MSKEKPIDLSYKALGYKRDIDGELIEPKPTPSIKVCDACGFAMTSSDWIRCPQCNESLTIPKPQPDSSSISTEQTFEEWWNKQGRLFLSGDNIHVQRCVMGISERAWNAAKGQSNEK